MLVVFQPTWGEVVTSEGENTDFCSLPLRISVAAGSHAFLEPRLKQSVVV